MRGFLGGVGVLSVLMVSGMAFAADPGLTCQASKLKTVAKYDSCRLTAYYKSVRAESSPDLSRCNLLRFADAEARANGACTTEGDQADVGAFVDFCTDSVAIALAGGSLPSDYLTCSDDLDACNDGLVGCEGDLSSTNADLGTCNGNLSGCTGSLAGCNGSLSACQNDLSSTNADLNACSSDLSATNADLADCQSDLGTATSGDATVGDVLATKTFTSSAGIGVTGTMPDNGAVSITPGTGSQAIAAGYHNGSGSVAGDADLVAGNIRSGVNLFGVAGTAVSGGLPKTGQTTSYGVGSDGDIEIGLARSFIDNGDGTITDSSTGLMWEKKSDDGSIHDKDNTYSWSSSNTAMDGTMVTSLLGQLNSGGGFAGYTDWRIPNIYELESLRNFEAAGNSPLVFPAFSTACAPGCTVTICSCSSNEWHWSSTTWRTDPFYAMHLSVGNGITEHAGFIKFSGRSVRAVRGGN